MIVVLGTTGNMGSTTGIGFLLAGVGILAGDTDIVGFGFICFSNNDLHPRHLTSIVPR